MIKARYLASRPDGDPKALAEAVAREQSLEIVPELIPDAIRRDYLGRVLDVTEVDDGRWLLEIGYPERLASAQIGQLLHLVYGNVSFYPRVRLVDLELPDSLLDALPGPLGGLPGIRQIIGVPDRALLMTVLKPRGSSPAFFAELALRFAAGGGDLLKDDQNLVESDLSDFTSRITKVAQSIDKSADLNGRRCLYLPHVAGSGDHLERQLDAVSQAGLSGVVLCPWVMGLESASSAARSRGLMWLAHPAVAGTFTEPAETGIATEILLGALVRAAGADISIFPGRGGRIQSSHDDVAATCAALTRPWAALAPTLPCTGGGKRLDDVEPAARERGQDFAVLVGGDLLRQADGMQTATNEAVRGLERAASV
jgi:ribulose-bisphosphate carboxylase large chain